MSDFPVYSHPPDEDSDGRLLDDHVRAVRDIQCDVTTDSSRRAPGGTPVSVLNDIADLTHDLGKANPEVQEYLRGEASGAPHAPLGAAAAFYAARSRGIPAVDASVAAVAVARHHQSLPKSGNPYEYLCDTFYETHLTHPSGDAPLYSIATDIGVGDDAPREVVQPYAEAANGESTWDEFVAALDDDLGRDMLTQLSDFGVVSDEVESSHYYATLLEVWSSLTFADKVEASGLTSTEATPPVDAPPTQTVRDEVASLGGDAVDGSRTAKLNSLRQEAFDLVNGESPGEGTIHDFADADSSVATLSLPTGLGKTLTGLTAALELRDATDADQVVYALPYTSIIDQTDAEVRDIFKVDPTDPQYTVHHHLSDTVTTFDEEESGRFTRDQRFLGECWQANIVLTTFVQLFESLLGPSNRQSTKLPNLSESVVVVDEPQALPVNDWDYVRDAAHVLTEHLGAQLVMMTATQPRLFAPDDRFDPVELVDSERDFAADAERVSYTFDESVGVDEDELAIPDASGRVVDEMGLGSDSLDEDSLVICNTIDSAREFAAEVRKEVERLTGRSPLTLNDVYENALRDVSVDPDEEITPETLDDAHPSADEILDRLPEFDGDSPPALVLHLSSRHRPVDREVLIDVVSEIAEDESAPPVAFVSTQIVEAGVDISFDRVYRDFAPLDGIVQAAGRCNREFERESSPVTVWQLDSVGGSANADADPPSEKVYATTGTNLLAVTRKALTEATGGLPVETVSDSVVSSVAVDEYYRLVKERSAHTGSPVQRAATDDLSEYSLIEEQCLRSIEAFVPRTEAEERFVERVRDLYGERRYSKLVDWIDALGTRVVSLGVYEPDPTPLEERCVQLTPDEDDIVDVYCLARRTSSDNYSFYDSFDGVTNEEEVDNYLV